VLPFFNKLIEDNTNKLGMTALIHTFTGLNSKIHENALRKTLTSEYFKVLRVVLSTKNHKYETLKQDEFI
jgi:hypothetical protein